VIGEALLRGVRQVLPACYVHLGPDRTGADTRYFRLDFSPTSAEEGLDAWVDRADAALDAYMQRLKQRHSSIGILLSGGVDSLLLALKAKLACFANYVALTARWPGENPELDLAIEIAKHIDIEHHVVDIDESRFELLLPWIVWRPEELPRHFNSLVLACLFEHDSTRFDTFLHGHSADVMFGASESVSIRTFNRRNRILGVMPRPLRLLLASQLPWNDNPRTRRLRQYPELDEHDYLKSQFAIEYGRQRAPIKHPYFHPRGPSRHVLEHFYEAGDPAVECMQRLDTYWFNQSHLAVLDRLGAPLGLPVLKPFLSPEVLDVARVLPSELRATGTEAKPVLKRLMARSFPREWVCRKKQGFPTRPVTPESVASNSSDCDVTGYPWA
jgi:asparagine synthetase B (glutamine-hydrolysing)